MTFEILITAANRAETTLEFDADTEQDAIDQVRTGLVWKEYDGDFDYAPSGPFAITLCTGEGNHCSEVTIER